MPNIEIKATYKNLEKAREICQSLKAEYVGLDRQVDTYFHVPHGRLKLRESSLSGAYLIPYIRPNQEGPKKSNYGILPVANAEHTKSLFAEMLGIDLVVKKNREIYLIDNVRVHLDEVDELGCFFEFEAVYDEDTEAQRLQEEKKVYDLMKVFDISENSLEKTSYQQLLTQVASPT
jgi:adenylate cyclase, class 2